MFIDTIKQESKKLEQFAKKNQCICDYCKKCGRIIYVGTEKIGMKDAYCKEEYCGCCWYKMSIIKDNDSIVIFQMDDYIIYKQSEEKFFRKRFFIHDKYSNLFEYKHYLQYHNFFIGV